MTTQRELQERQIKQSSPPKLVLDKRIQQKPDDITRWEGEGGQVLPTGPLTPNLLTQSPAGRIR